MRTGTFWYRMTDGDGEPIGYAWMEIAPDGDDGRRVAWELKIVHGGGAYEEERTLVLDGDRAMTAASWRSGDDRVEARRAGGRMKGVVVRGGEERPLDVAVDESAQAGLGFVLAADLPQREGAEWLGRDVNEAQEFADGGPLALRVTGRETVGGVDAWKVQLTGGESRQLPVWVDDDRRIVQVDWGGGTRMTLSDEPTGHLFRPPPPRLRELEPDDPARLVLVGTFEDVSPDAMFARWTTPEGLTSFWVQEATVDAEVGGRYHLAWPEANWLLRGRITAFEPGRRLAFTWQWDHRPDDPERVVEITLEPADGGTRLHLVHGPYGNDERERRERRGHHEGWQVLALRL